MIKKMFRELLKPVAEKAKLLGYSPEFSNTINDRCNELDIRDGYETLMFRIYHDEDLRTVRGAPRFCLKEPGCIEKLTKMVGDELLNRLNKPVGFQPSVHIIVYLLY